jgi:uncharacterized membrane protein YedE/YeeE
VARRFGVKNVFVALGAGVIFGLGLAWSTMVQPEVVLDFLLWHDFGLMLVLGAGVAVVMAGYQGLPRVMKGPVLGGAFGKHAAKLDRRTVAGAALFGMGWGLSGVCPGPAIAGLGTGNWGLAWAVVGLLAGAWVQGVTAE